MINWRQIPVLRLLIPFMLGIICALHVEVGLPSGTYVIAIYLLGLIIWAIYPIFNTRFSFGYAVQFFLLLWGYHFTHQFHAERCPHYLIADTPAPTFFTGVVHEVPHTQKWIRAVITLQNAGQHTDSLNHGCGQLLAYIEPDTQRATPQYGDRIAFKGNPQRIESPKNPAGFDWRNFYFKENIHHRVFIPKENWQLVSSGHGHPLYAQMISWRLGGIAILRKYLPRASDFSVAAALVLGYKGEMDEEVREAYQTVGATHVLAVSGLHVGLVVWLLRLLLQRIRCYHPAWRYLRSMLLLLAVGLFVLVTGAPPSVCRAALLFSFILVGKDWARQISTYNLLATSAFVLLVYDPYLLLDIGFQLSYLAMIGILYFQPRIYNWFSFTHSMADKIWQLLSVSFAAQWMTLPISIYYFHQIPIYFWLSSLVVIPTAAFILGGGFLLFLTATIAPGIAVWVGMALGILISIVNECMFLLERIPYNLIKGIWWEDSLVFCVYIMIAAWAIAFARRATNAQWLQIGLLALVCIGGQYMYQQFQIYQQRQIIIYHAPRHSLIDCIDRRTAFTLQADSMEARQVDFYARNYRQRISATPVHTISLSRVTPFGKEGFYYQPNQLQFYHTQLTIVDHRLTRPLGHKWTTDYLLVRNTPDIEIGDLVQHFDFEQIIFDSSNQYYQVREWKADCTVLGLDCYDVSQEGAWVKNLPVSTKQQGGLGRLLQRHLLDHLN